MRTDHIPIDEASFLATDPELVRRMVDVITRDDHAKNMLAKARDLRIAADAAKIEHIASEYCTEDFIATGPESYWYWVQREGHEFWADKANRAQYLRDNPHARRKVVTGRTVVTNNAPFARNTLIHTAA